MANDESERQMSIDEYGSLWICVDLRRRFDLIVTPFHNSSQSFTMHIHITGDNTTIPDKTTILRELAHIIISMLPKSNLIVDFPQPEERNLIVDFPNDDIQSSPADEHVTRKVHFSTASELCVYECRYDDINIDKIWYSGEEYHAMRAEFKRNVRKTYEMHRYSISQMSPRHVHNMNRVRAVLDEQERQDRSGITNMDMLACVSRRYSQWSKIRAKIHIERFQ